MKKNIVSLGTIGAITIPLMAVISRGDNKKSETGTPKTPETGTPETGTETPNSLTKIKGNYPFNLGISLRN